MQAPLPTLHMHGEAYVIPMGDEVLLNQTSAYDDEAIDGGPLEGEPPAALGTKVFKKDMICPTLRITPILVAYSALSHKPPYNPRNLFHMHSKRWLSCTPQPSLFLHATHNIVQGRKASRTYHSRCRFALSRQDRALLRRLHETENRRCPSSEVIKHTITVQNVQKSTEMRDIYVSKEFISPEN